WWSWSPCSGPSGARAAGTWSASVPSSRRCMRRQSRCARRRPRRSSASPSSRSRGSRFATSGTSPMPQSRRRRLPRSPPRRAASPPPDSAAWDTGSSGTSSACSSRPPLRGSASMAGSAWRGRPGLILGVLTALNGLNYLDRYVAAATLTLILADLRLPDSQGGLLQSMFIVTYALACPLAGWLGDRGSRMRLAAGGIFIWRLATVGSGLAPSSALLLLARAVTGIGEAGYGVVTPPLLSDCYPPARRAAMLGIFYAAIPVGSALGYIVGGVVGEAYGWRAAFFVAGAPGVALAFVLLLLAEPPRGSLDAA